MGGVWSVLLRRRALARSLQGHGRGGGVSQLCVGIFAFPIGREICRHKIQGLCEWPSSTEPAKPYTPQHFWGCLRSLPHISRGVREIYHREFDLAWNAPPPCRSVLFVTHHVQHEQGASTRGRGSSPFLFVLHASGCRGCAGMHSKGSDLRGGPESSLMGGWRKLPNWLGAGNRWLQMPSKPAQAVRETVAGPWLGALEGGG